MPYRASFLHNAMTKFPPSMQSGKRQVSRLQMYPLLLQVDTYEPIGSRRDAPNAAALSKANSELEREQRLQSYHHMTKRELEDIFNANGLLRKESYLNTVRNELLASLYAHDSLLTVNRGTPTSRVQQAADAYIAAYVPAAVSLPTLASTAAQKEHHYKQFPEHELQALCKQHKLQPYRHNGGVVGALTANDALLRAGQVELSSGTQHDADAAFAAQPDFPAPGSTYQEQAKFWDLLTYAQLAQICARQGIWIRFNKPSLIKLLIAKSSFEPAAQGASKGRQGDADAAAATIPWQPSHEQPLASSSRSEITH